MLPPSISVTRTGSCDIGLGQSADRRLALSAKRVAPQCGNKVEEGVELRCDLGDVRG
jgi:hypothetical protein